MRVAAASSCTSVAGRASAAPWASDVFAIITAAPNSIHEVRRTGTATQRGAVHVQLRASQTAAWRGKNGHLQARLDLRYVSGMRPARTDAQFSFGRYETMFRIGTGGMAEVFAARLCGEAGFERLSAIKRLLPHLAEDSQYVARFLDEGRLAACIVHPHVVQTLDLGRTDDGEPFLVLELIVGSSLDRLIRSAPRPPAAVLLS
jgi:hypothetical protein